MICLKKGSFLEAFHLLWKNAKGVHEQKFLEKKRKLPQGSCCQLNKSRKEAKKCSSSNSLSMEGHPVDLKQQERNCWRRKSVLEPFPEAEIVTVTPEIYLPDQGASTEEPEAYEEFPEAENSRTMGRGSSSFTPKELLQYEASSFIDLFTLLSRKSIKRKTSWFRQNIRILERNLCKL